MNELNLNMIEKKVLFKFCYPFSPPVIKLFFGIVFKASFHFEKHSMKLHKPKK